MNSARRRQHVGWTPQGVRGALLVGIFVVASGLCPSEATAQVVATAEEVEAAYIYRFVGYLDWPPKVFSSASAPIVIGVAGSDRMFELVSAAVAGRPVQGRSIEVRRLATPEQSAQVQLVFVGKGAWKDLPNWAAASNEHSTVVATDAPQGVDRGATLAFVQSGERIRFEASLPAAEKSGVKVSARLLAVAERVVGGP